MSINVTSFVDNKVAACIVVRALMRCTPIEARDIVEAAQAAVAAELERLRDRLLALAQGGAA